ncbi:MAG: DUF6056 family protein [Clostridiales Family XIII bacterium]|jgi:hypothetical protein|nr:DUF6056 family protein [Clostridiales Family XIII bacterium]
MNYKAVWNQILAVLPFLAFFVAFYALLLPIELRGASDDTAHLDAIRNMGVLDWVRMRAEEWQPRLFSDTLFAGFLFRLPLWKVCNAAVMTVLLGVVSLWARTGTGLDGAKGPNARAKAALGALACLLLFLVFPNVITSGAVWFTGSFYYLWPVCAMLIGLLPFGYHLYEKGPLLKAGWLPLCFLGSLCAAFTEQTAAVQIGVAVLILAYGLRRKRRPPAVLWAQFALMLVVCAAFFYGDFTSPRVLLKEELALFPAFADFSLPDKLMLGVNVYDTHLLHSSNILFLVLAVLAALLCFRRARGVFRFGGLFAVAWALAHALPLRFWVYTEMSAGMLGRPSALPFGMDSFLDFLNNTPPMDGGLEAGPLSLAVLSLVCVLSVFVPLLFAFPDHRDRVLACVLYLASFLSGILIGFSATVWASESRPFFLSNVLLLIVILMLIRSTKIKIAPVAALCAFAVYAWWLYHTTFATNVYWWY